MKTIEVVAAVIFDEQGRIFATQRGYGEWKDWWEFPGGKIEAGETSEQALKREIHEELDAEIEVGELLRTIDKWLAPSELHSVRWLPADEQIIDILSTYGYNH